jgi:ribonuclease HI
MVVKEILRQWAARNVYNNWLELPQQLVEQLQLQRQAEHLLPDKRQRQRQHLLPMQQH